MANNTWNGTEWVFACSDGPSECIGNLYMACANANLSNLDAINYTSCAFRLAFEVNTPDW